MAAAGMNGRAASALAMLAIGGCATSGPSLEQRRARCGLETRPFPVVLAAMRAEAESWLTFVEYRPGPSYDAGPSQPRRQLEPVDGGPHLALLSYPGVPRSDPTSARSFVYDDALAQWCYENGFASRKSARPPIHRVGDALLGVAPNHDQSRCRAGAVI